jgi:hypothetical protein
MHTVPSTLQPIWVSKIGKPCKHSSQLQTEIFYEHLITYFELLIRMMAQVSLSHGSDPEHRPSGEYPQAIYLEFANCPQAVIFCDGFTGSPAPFGKQATELFQVKKSTIVRPGC